MAPFGGVLSGRHAWRPTDTRADEFPSTGMGIARFLSIVVLTGAGASAESGVPGFRGTDGLRRQYQVEGNTERTPLTALALEAHQGKAGENLPA